MSKPEELIKDWQENGAKDFPPGNEGWKKMNALAAMIYLQEEELKTLRGERENIKKSMEEWVIEQIKMGHIKIKLEIVKERER